MFKRYLFLIDTIKKNYFLVLSIHKRIILMSYIYPINSSSEKFTISILYCIHILKVSFSKISLHTLSKKILT